MRIAHDCFVVVTGNDVICVQAINRRTYQVRYTVNGTVYNDTFNAGDMLRVENTVFVFKVGEIVHNNINHSVFISRENCFVECSFYRGQFVNMQGYSRVSRGRVFARVTKRVTLVFGKSMLPSLLIRKR